jgi:hypothetical protein
MKEQMKKEGRNAELVKSYNEIDEIIFDLKKYFK